MKVFLTGADGVMGRSAAAALLHAGHTLVALTSSAEGTRALRAHGAHVLRGSLLDHDGIREGMTGCDAVVSLVDAPRGRSVLWPGTGRRVARARTAGSARVAAAAREAGVPRLVQESASVIYGDAADDWVDEHSSIGLTHATEPYVVAEVEAEVFGREAGDGVVLRFGQVLGPEPFSRWMVRRARSGRPTGFGDPRSWMHPLHVDDVGSSVLAALGAPTGTYNVGAEPCRRVDLAEQLALAGDRHAPRFHSGLALRLGGQRMEMVTRSQRVSSQRFADVAGWFPEHPKLTPDWFDDVR